MDELKGGDGESVAVEFEELERGEVGGKDTAKGELLLNPCFIFALGEPRF